MTSIQSGQNVQACATRFLTCTYFSCIVGREMHMREIEQVTKLQVRLPKDVLQRMKELARQEDRSLNGEIVQALREFIARRPGRGDRDRDQV